MGIKGLHKALSFCTIKDNVRNHSRASVAVDTSSWMHKSVYSIAEKFVEATDTGRLDEVCIRISARYIVARCKELIENFGIGAVYLVMDGRRIPLKKEETLDRDQKRQTILEEARRLKRSGQRWKAEEKYKSCIRVKDEFTNSVVEEVRKAFIGYDRVYFVKSPHEADSQLTRLVLDGVANVVITEDSDVLVYSAAAHVSFPILFKVDRKTGDCDRISMDWLLSPGSEESTKKIPTKNTIETIFRRLAMRQAKREGFGVRLFVQGCILSGCDYRKNIEGIGMINAFKLVRDNAFRNDSVRFRKILESLPSRIRQKININEYEEILAKSEAIFFYHPVLHTDGNIKPLLTPRTSSDKSGNGNKHHFTDHYPCMSRFQDTSFLGTVSSSSSRNVKYENMGRGENKPCKAEESAEMLEEPSPVRMGKDRCFQLLSTNSKIIKNPYKKSKSVGIKGYLVERNVNSYSGPRNELVSKIKPNSQNSAGDITRFLKKPDPRYAKRPFDPTANRTHEKRRTPADSFFLPRVTKKKKPNAFVKSEYYFQLPVTTNRSNFSYPTLDRSNEYEYAEDKGTWTTNLSAKSGGFLTPDRPDFYDLTDSNSCGSDDLDDESTRFKLTEENPALGAVPTEAPRAGHVENCSSTLENLVSKDQWRENDNQGIITSKFFRNRTGTGSRRVTLDSLNDSSCSRKPGLL